MGQTEAVKLPFEFSAHPDKINDLTNFQKLLPASHTPPKIKMGCYAQSRFPTLPPRIVLYVMSILNFFLARFSFFVFNFFKKKSRHVIHSDLSVYL